MSDGQVTANALKSTIYAFGHFVSLVGILDGSKMNVVCMAVNQSIELSSHLSYFTQSRALMLIRKAHLEKTRETGSLHFHL